jgi:hypothetical protein
MASRTGKVLDDVVAILTGAGLSQSFTPLKKFYWEIRPKDFPTLTVLVLPAARKIDTLVRSRNIVTVSVAVVVMKMIGKTDPATVDPLIQLTEEIEDRLSDHTYRDLSTSGASRTGDPVLTDPPYDAEMMKNPSAFVAVIGVDYAMEVTR